MPGVRFDENDKPIHDLFDLPVVCDHDDDADCCDLCASWLHCLKRTPFKLDLAGFDFADWLANIQMSPEVYRAANLAQFSGDGGDGEWLGTYIALPESTFCATHLLPVGRTILTPNSEVSPTVEFNLSVEVECETNELDQLCVKFTVWLKFAHEPGQGGDTACLPNDFGPWAPPIAPWDTGDPIDFVDDADPPERASDCCKLLESVLIPLAGLAWEDLEDVALLPVAQPVPDPSCDLGSCNSCGRPLLHKVSPRDLTNPAPCDGGLPLELVNECAAGSPGIIDRSLMYFDASENECFASAQFCCPPPIVKHEGSTLSVLAESCTIPTDCSHCVRPPGASRATPATPVVVDFTWTLVNCCKTFTAVVPDCLKTGEGELLGANLLYFWSFGQEGEEVGYCLRNVNAEDVTEKEELIHLTVVNLDTGCIYYAEHLVDCGCCEGVVTGNVEAETTANPCEYVLHVTGTNSSETCIAQICIFNQCTEGGPAEPPDCVPCFDEDCFECIQIAADGGTVDTTTAAFTVSGPCKVYWQVWDQECGCAGPMNTIELDCSPCDCCTGSIGGALMSLSGIVNGGTLGSPCNCTVLNVTDIDVPRSADEECQYDSSTPATVVSVTCGVDTADATIAFAWEISCTHAESEPPPGFPDPSSWLNLSVSIVEPFGSGTTNLQVFILLGEDELVPCATISECIEIDGGESAFCDYQAVTLCAEFYA